MSKFEYYFIFETILYGLMLSMLIQGVNKIYTYRKKVRGYWPYYFLLFYIFSRVINSFYDNLNSPLYETVDTEGYFLLIIITPPLLLYSVIHHGFPDKYTDCDFREFLLQTNRKIIFLLAFFWSVFVISRSVIEWAIESHKNPFVVYFETWREPWFIIPNGFTLLALVIAFVKNELLIKVFAVLSVISVFLFFFVI